MSEVDESTLVEQGAIPPNDFHNSIERIGEVANYELQVPEDIFDRLRHECRGLLVAEETLKSAASALQCGNLILQGPPGTGKSSIARAISRAFNVSDLSVTAHEDWTVYEVIGRLELRVSTDRAEQIEPVNGFFTEGVIRCAGAIVRNFDDPDEPQAEWLIIDELNRAYIDKAFGELFTVLGTDESVAVALPHQRLGNRELVVPRRFRIIATINSVDRQFVNSLSQAIRRRFTFVSVDIPDRKKATARWDVEAANGSMAVEELRVVIDRAAMRLARRLANNDSEAFDAVLDKIRENLRTSALPAIIALFEFAEQVRYADSSSEVPYLPIGTATLIDTVELFASRVQAESIDESQMTQRMDWATSIKIAPLFDSGSASPQLISAFANSLDVFSGATRTELLKIVAAGMHYVE